MLLVGNGNIRVKIEISIYDLMHSWPFIMGEIAFCILIISFCTSVVMKIVTFPQKNDFQGSPIYKLHLLLNLCIL